ncbi:type I polyketide synthase [Mycobacterium sp. Aquia_213]|uniref:type I polyketide synthase n=1 Tax=Mycobacterium sp. Aquia_213 TaxID=2991728 RepID=UPI00226E36C2|nr:type I polyketide synthase [Mycobacterium sp. Aquia_213]WAC90180.1 SDR family NAD(P)-dependent oxidoreductase [Mycobacterium sp. Aquia_213]
MNGVAIVGIGCRFPGGVHDAESYWNFLLDKGDGVVDIPADRWNVDKYYDPDPDAPGRMYTRRGGFLTDSLWDFDPEFFGISPREASIMDVQQRLLLEVSWEALDDAGLAACVSGRPVGVYIGAFTADNAIKRCGMAARMDISGHTAMSYTFTLLSNRISYVLDLQGPSMTIDTACSSSLVAFHQATQAVLTGECDLALAGGVNSITQPEAYVSMSKGRFLSPDGRSKAFDASADGYGRGEGAGVVVLKRLDVAQRDGDRIYAVVRGTGVNQDGKTAAIPVPNPIAQENLARRVCADAGVEPHDVAYVEAHGTGTPVGDPLEVSALGKVYGNIPGRQEPLAVGSVKASIGHLEAAAGIAGVIKTALTLHHRAIAPQGWLENPNPDIPFDDLNISIPTEVQRIRDGRDKVFAAVNSFGYGGTNAHAVLAAAPPQSAATAATFPVLPISARNPAAVRELAGRFAALVEAGADLDSLVAAAWTRRAHHQFRSAFDYSDTDDLLTKLQNFAQGEGRQPTRAIASDAAQPVFVFSGMGPQWWAMGRDLLQADGEFARMARVIDDEFGAIAGWSIVEELSRAEEDSKVTNTEIAQPANFLVQVALVAELAKLGVHPVAVVGHSVGEVSAAYVSGALSLRDAVRVSYHRSRLQATTTGAMLAVGLTPADAVAEIPAGDEISVAAVNGPTAVTLAGSREAIERMYEKLAEAGVFARLLQVEVGYHSHLMDPILDEIRSTLADVEPKTPSIPLYSTVHGRPVSGPEWDANYWCRNVREPVCFADTVTSLVKGGYRVFLEVGPNPVLSGNIREMLVRAGETGASIGTLSRKEGDLVSLRHTIAELYTAGALDGSTVPGGSSVNPHVALPAYPWQKTHVWTESDSVVRERMASDSRFPMLGQRRETSASEWTVDLSVAGLPWLQDHVVEGLVVLPGAAYLDAALSAAAIRTGREDLALEDIRFVTPLVIDPHDVPVLRLTVEDATKRFTISSRTGTGTVWTMNANGRFVEGPVRSADVELPPEGDATIVINGRDMYPALAAHGLQYGSAFQGIVQARVGDDAVVATIDTSVARDTAHLVHPAVLDVALQCVAAIGAGSGTATKGAIVPASVHSVRRFGPIPRSAATVVVRRRGIDPLLADVDLIDADGSQIVAMTGVEFRPVSPPASIRNRLGQLFYEPRWELCDSLDPLTAEADAADEFTLVIALGDVASPWAAPIADRHPNARSHRISDPLLPRLEDDIAAMLRDGIAASGTERANVIVVAGTGFDGSANVTAVACVARATSALLDQSTAGGDESNRPALDIRAAIVTTYGFCLPGSSVEADMAHAALVGARRSLLNEQPMSKWRLIDTGPDTSADEVVAEALRTAEGQDESDEVCLSLGSRWVLRVRKNLVEHLESRDELRTLNDPEVSFALESPDSRLLQDLAWREVGRVDPLDGQIEVRMEAIGLNPKDVFKVLGVLTAKDMEDTFFGMDIGLEGAGTVVRIGPGVSDVAVGDRVGVCARNMVRRFLTIDRNFATVLPGAWEAGACSSNVPFLTAEFALVDSARIRAGETVLIHGAAGGVGLAALQVARSLGATVIATAGSEERRSHVLAAGAHHAIDSRSMNFVDDVMRITEGRGVDVVLNSAPGEIVRQNLRVAAEFGRVVDIGKVDIYSGGVIDLRPFDHNLTFIALDLDRMMKFRPEAVRAKTVELIEKFKAGIYQHLPYHMYSINDVAAAFDAVARPKKIGRVVLDLDEPAPKLRPQIPAVGIRSDAAYLVSGGFGAFGLATARWLVREGARHLILVGRSGPSSVEAKNQMAAFADAGVEVTEERLDIADYNAVAAMVKRTKGRGVPLRGVFHAAGVVDNSPVKSITAEVAANVFAPKVAGAMNLDHAVHEMEVDLDHFVLWSSISGLIGGFPQVCYAAANASLQSLAHSRRSRGEPALCVDWGSMSGGGMAEANEETVRYLSAVGLQPIDMDVATDYLAECLRLDLSHVSIVDMDWRMAVATTYAVTHSARFAEFATGAAAEQDGAAALRAEILSLPADERGAAVAAALAEVMAVVLGVSTDAVDVETPLLELGIDSLMAVEFAARTSKLIGVELSPVEMARGLGLGLSSIGNKMAAELENKEEAKAA